jgi:hypothetical protein
VAAIVSSPAADRAFVPALAEMRARAASLVRGAHCPSSQNFVSCGSLTALDGLAMIDDHHASVQHRALSPKKLDKSCLIHRLKWIYTLEGSFYTSTQTLSENSCRSRSWRHSTRIACGTDLEKIVFEFAPFRMRMWIEEDTIGY